MQSLILLALALGLGPGEGHVEDFEGPSAEGWERVSAEAYPPYNAVERVYQPDDAKSGSQFLRFRTMGGSTAVRRSGQQPWAIEAGRPYRLSVWTRLARTKRNRASLSLTWVSAAGDPLLDQRSAAVERTDGWTLLSIELPKTPPGAVGILPCLNFDGDDVRGTCDFDLLTLVPIERIEIKPVGRSWPVFTPEEYPRTSVSPAGLPDGVHTVTALLRLADGAELRRAATLRLPDEPSTMIDFPPAPVGAHELTVTVDGHDARGTMAILVPPPGMTLTDDVAVPDAAAFPSVEAALRSRILNPDKPVALTPLFLDGGTGKPTRALYALHVVDTLRARALPIADPGLFPASVRVAAFRREASILMALWCENGETEIVAGLHEGLHVQTVYGAPRELRVGERLRIGALPVFLVDLDPLWTELRFALSVPELPLQRGSVRIAARVENRSRVESPRDVTVALEEVPAGWRIAPRRFKTPALAPGTTHSEDLDIVLPPTESERVQDLKFELRFSVQGREQVMHVVRSLRIKSVLAIDAAVADGPAPGTRRLTVRILNGSDRSMTLSVRARIPGLPERLELVRDLGAGGRSSAFEYVVKDAEGAAEISVQESGSDRASARRSIPLR